MEHSKTTLKRLRRLSRWTGARLRLNDTVRRLSLLLPVPLVYALAALTVIKVWRPSHEIERIIVLSGLIPLAVLIAGVALAALRRRPPYHGALALDRHYGLRDRITNALAFDALPSASRTPFMHAAIDDALGVARDVRPRHAAPIRVPPDLLVAALLAGAVYGISLFEVQTVRYLPPEQPSIEPLVMSPDDVELFRDLAEQVEEGSESPEVRAAVRRFNQLIEDIADRRLDRREVFRRLEELEQSLMNARDLDESAIDEGLGGVAQELKRSDLTKPVAKALEDKRLKDAEQAMRELAEKLKDRKKKVDKARLEELRKALEKASRANVDRVKNIESKRQELEERRKRLLKKKKEKGLTKQEQKELDKLERRLERLTREKKRAKRSQRQLSDLDRELAKAAQELMKELGESAKSLEQGAEELNRVARKQMTRKEKEALKRRLEELRELLRQQGQGGKKRLERLLKFGQRARGGKPGGQGQGDKEGKGQGKKGGGKGLVLRPGSGKGVDILMPGQGAPMPGSGQPGDQEGSGAGQGGSEWGTGHDPSVKGDKSEIDHKTQDVSAAGIDTGEGQAASEVIYGAAERGFVGRGYKKVFTDYETVAEDVLHTEEIPAGYEFYVRRYFQLIRPRE